MQLSVSRRSKIRINKDLKGDGCDLLQSKYFGVRLRALTKTRYTGTRMQEVS
jgi:hypothetical protein